MKVKTILISQPEPKADNSPYTELIEKHNVKIDFIPFIHVDGVESREVRQQKIDLTQFTSIILTSRNAVDHFFRIAEEMRYPIPNTLKYFCQSEAVAFYLQKYVVYRKRKIYVARRTFHDLVEIIKKHETEKFLLPSSDVLKPSISKTLDSLKINWKRGIFYKTVVSDLSHLEDVFYDILVFFSPSGIKSLYENFPKYEQKNTKIAVFGNSTLSAAKEHGLNINIKAPTPQTPSMTKALEDYIKKNS